MHTQARAYPEKFRFLSAFRVTRCTAPYLGIPLVTPKALNNINFSSYSRPAPHGNPSRYTKATEKSELFKKPSHLGTDRVTPKALKNPNL